MTAMIERRSNLKDNKNENWCTEIGLDEIAEEEVPIMPMNAKHLRKLSS